MSTDLQVAPARAISPAVQTDADSAQTGSEFFANVCRDVFGKDAGLHLHYATDVPERSCYRYASGEREVPVLVLRTTIHSDHGKPFFLALMDGCTAQWWIEFQRNEELGAAAFAKAQEILKR